MLIINTNTNTEGTERSVCIRDVSYWTGRNDNITNLSVHWQFRVLTVLCCIRMILEINVSKTSILTCSGIDIAEW